MVRLRLTGDKVAPEHAADVAAFQQDEIERRLGDFARGKADHQAAVPSSQRRARPARSRRRRPDHRRHRRRGRRVRRFSSARKSLRRVIDRLRRAEFPHEGELFVRRGAGDHPRPHPRPDLDRRQADAARGAEDHQGLAALQFGALLQGVQRRAVGDRQPGRLLLAKADREARPAGRRRSDPFARAAKARCSRAPGRRS